MKSLLGDKLPIFIKFFVMICFMIIDSTLYSEFFGPYVENNLKIEISKSYDFENFLQSCSALIFDSE